MGMNIKILMGGIAAIIISILVGVGSLALTGKGEVSAASEVAPVAIATTAMNAKNDPMDPISSVEADRRATLHNESAEIERADADPAYVATPVVERVGSLGDPDELATKLFGNDLFSSEPRGRVIGVEASTNVEVVEPKPEPKPVVVVVEEPEPEPVDPDLDKRMLLARAGSSAANLQVIESSNVPKPVVHFMEE